MAQQQTNKINDIFSGGLFDINNDKELTALDIMSSEVMTTIEDSLIGSSTKLGPPTNIRPPLEGINPDDEWTAWQRQKQRNERTLLQTIGQNLSEFGYEGVTGFFDTATFGLLSSLGITEDPTENWDELTGLGKFGAGLGGALGFVSPMGVAKGLLITAPSKIISKFGPQVVKKRFQANAAKTATTEVMKIASKHGIRRSADDIAEEAVEGSFYKNVLEDWLMKPIAHFGDTAAFSSARALNTFNNAMAKGGGEYIERKALDAGFKIGKRTPILDKAGRATGKYENKAVNEIQKYLAKHWDDINHRPVKDITDGLVAFLGDSRYASGIVKMMEEGIIFAGANVMLHRAHLLGVEKGFKEERKTKYGKPESYADVIKHGLIIGNLLGGTKILPWKRFQGGGSGKSPFHPFSREGRFNLKAFFGAARNLGRRTKVTGSDDAAKQGRESIAKQFKFYAEMNDDGMNLIIQRTIDDAAVLEARAGLGGAYSWDNFRRILQNPKSTQEQLDAVGQLMQKVLGNIGKHVRGPWRGEFVKLKAMDLWSSLPRMAMTGTILQGGPQVWWDEHIPMEDKVVNFLTGAVLGKKAHHLRYMGRTSGGAKEWSTWNGYSSKILEFETQLREQRQMADALGVPIMAKGRSKITGKEEEYIHPLWFNVMMKAQDPYLNMSVWKSLKIDDTDPKTQEAINFVNSKDNKTKEPLYLVPESKKISPTKDKGDRNSDALDDYNNFIKIFSSDQYILGRTKNGEKFRFKVGEELSDAQWNYWMGMRNKWGFQSGSYKIIQKYFKSIAPNYDLTLSNMLDSGFSVSSLIQNKITGSSTLKWIEKGDTVTGIKYYEVRPIISHPNNSPREVASIQEYNHMINFLARILPNKVKVKTRDKIQISKTDKGYDKFVEGMETVLINVKNDLGLADAKEVFTFKSRAINAEFFMFKFLTDGERIEKLINDSMNTESKEKTLETTVRDLLSRIYTDGQGRIAEFVKTSNLSSSNANFIKDLQLVMTQYGESIMNRNRFIKGTFDKFPKNDDVKQLRTIFEELGFAQYFQTGNKDKTGVTRNDMSQYVAQIGIEKHMENSLVGKEIGKTKGGTPIYETRPYNLSDLYIIRQLRAMNLMDPYSTTTTPLVGILGRMNVKDLKDVNFETLLKQMNVNPTDVTSIKTLVEEIKNIDPNVELGDIVKQIQDLVEPHIRKNVKIQTEDGKLIDGVVGSITYSTLENVVLTEAGARLLLVNLNNVAKGIYDTKVNAHYQDFQKLMRQEESILTKAHRELLDLILSTHRSQKFPEYWTALVEAQIINEKTGRFYPWVFKANEKKMSELSVKINKIIENVYEQNDTLEHFLHLKTRLEEQEFTNKQEVMEQIARGLRPMFEKYKVDSESEFAPKGRDKTVETPVSQFVTNFENRTDIGKTTDLVDYLLRYEKEIRDPKNNNEINNAELVTEIVHVLNSWKNPISAKRLRMDLNNRPSTFNFSFSNINPFLERYMEILRIPDAVPHDLVFVDSRAVGYGKNEYKTLSDRNTYDGVTIALQDPEKMLALEYTYKFRANAPLDKNINPGEKLPEQKEKDRNMSYQRYITYTPDVADYAMAIPMEATLLNHIAAQYVKYARSENKMDSLEKLGIKQEEGGDWYYDINGKDSLGHRDSMQIIMDNLIFSRLMSPKKWNAVRNLPDHKMPKVLKYFKQLRNQTGFKQSSEGDMLITKYLENTDMKFDGKDTMLEVSKRIVNEKEGEGFDSIAVSDEETLPNGEKSGVINAFLSSERTRKEQVLDNYNLEEVQKGQFVRTDGKELNDFDKRVLAAMKAGKIETGVNSASIINPKLQMYLAFKMGLLPKDAALLSGIKFIGHRYDKDGIPEINKTAGIRIGDFDAWFKKEQYHLKDGQKLNEIGMITFSSGLKDIVGYGDELNSRLISINSWSDLDYIRRKHRVRLKSGDMTLLSLKIDKKSKLAPNFTTFINDMTALQDYYEYNFVRQELEIKNKMNKFLRGEAGDMQELNGMYNLLLGKRYQNRNLDLNFDETQMGTSFHLSNTRNGISAYFDVDSYIELLHDHYMAKANEVSHGYESVIVPDIVIPRKIYDVKVDMYEHPKQLGKDNKPVDIWMVDNMKEAEAQLEAIRKGLGKGKNFTGFKKISKNYWILEHTKGDNKHVLIKGSKDVKKYLKVDESDLTRDPNREKGESYYKSRKVLRNSLVDENGVIDYGEIRESHLSGYQKIDPEQFFFLVNRKGMESGAHHINVLIDKEQRKKFLEENDLVGTETETQLLKLTKLDATMTRKELHEVIKKIEGSGLIDNFQLASLNYRNPIAKPNSILIMGVQGFTDAKRDGNVHVINTADVIRELEGDYDIDTVISIGAQPQSVFNAIRNVRGVAGIDSELYSLGNNPTYKNVSLKDFPSIRRYIEDKGISEINRAYPMLLPRIIQFLTVYNPTETFTFKGKEVTGAVFQTGKNDYIIMKEGFDTYKLLGTINQHLFDAENKGWNKNELADKTAIFDRVLFGEEGPFKKVFMTGQRKPVRPGEQIGELQSKGVTDSKLNSIDKLVIRKYMQPYLKLLSNVKNNYDTGLMKQTTVKDELNAFKDYIVDINRVEDTIKQSLTHEQKKQWKSITGKSLEQFSFVKGMNINANPVLGDKVDKHGNVLYSETKKSLLPLEANLLMKQKIYSKIIEISKVPLEDSFIHENITSHLLKDVNRVSDTLKYVNEQLKDAVSKAEYLKSLTKRRTRMLEQLGQELNMPVDQIRLKKKIAEQLKDKKNIDIPYFDKVREDIVKTDKLIGRISRDLNESWQKDGATRKEATENLISYWVGELKKEEWRKWIKDNSYTQKTDKEIRIAAKEKAMKEGIEVDYAQPDIDTIFAYATQLMWGDMGRASMKELGADLGAYGGRFEMDIEAYLDFHRKGLNSVTTGEGTIARNDWNKFQEMSMLEID